MAACLPRFARQPTRNSRRTAENFRQAAEHFGKLCLAALPKIETPIAPGPVLTSAVMHGYDYGTASYPIPRMGTPEDMAETVAFLCSPVSGYITGEVIKVAGGVGM